MPSISPLVAFLALTLAGCGDGDVPPGETDEDGDGFAGLQDCDDGDPSVHPGAVEVVADGIDQDCDDGDACYQDSDEDGYGSAQTLASANLSCWDYGESRWSTDCDDADPATYPGAPEAHGDEKDQDCDGGEVCFQDLDGDGYGTQATLSSADTDCRDAGESRFATDCDDAEPDLNPGVEEICNDHLDNDCDGFEWPCALTGDFRLSEADATLVGEAEEDHAGVAVAMGDMDGDGADEVLAGALRYGDDRMGELYLLDGPLTGTVDLSLADARLLGDHEFGSDNAILTGDVDGDGTDDVLVDTNVRWNDAPDVAYLVYGPVSGVESLTFADARLLKEGVRTFSLGLGDLNGDAIADVIVGRWDAPDTIVRTAHVLYGPVYGDIHASMADAWIEGGKITKDHSFFPVVGGLDVDGDGFQDLLLATEGEDDDAYPPGTVHVVAGPVWGIVSLSSAIATRTGGEDTQLGEALAAGDTNGDGYDDVVASGDGNHGYVFLGPVSGAHPAAEADAVLETTYGGRGSLATGDVDGDGVGDVVIGIPGDEDLDRRSIVYLAYGPFSGEMELSDTGARFIGDMTDSAGRSVAVGDVNDDGLDDGLIGAPSDDVGGKHAGAAYLFYGSGL